VIFDRNAADARLIGIEYIISKERFSSLSNDEKRLWHSHHYEVTSGILVHRGFPISRNTPISKTLRRHTARRSTHGSTIAMIFRTGFRS
jgi:Protein of unknown function (DUF1264)